MKTRKPWSIKIDKGKFWDITTTAGYLSLTNIYKQEKEVLKITYNHLCNVVNGKADVSLRVRKALIQIFTTRGIPQNKILSLFKTTSTSTTQTELSYAITHTHNAKKIPCA